MRKTSKMATTGMHMQFVETGSHGSEIMLAAIEGRQLRFWNQKDGLELSENLYI
jgi:hypothetical protein